MENGKTNRKVISFSILEIQKKKKKKNKTKQETTKKKKKTKKNQLHQIEKLSNWQS